MQPLIRFNPCLRCLTKQQDEVCRKFLSLSPVFIRLFSSVSHYEVLDVPKNASQDEIKKAFFEKSKKYHPDVSPGNPHHHKLFVKLNNAYSILSNISKRRDYDRSLKPKPTYNHQSNQNLYKYRNESFYYGHNYRTSSNGRESSQHRSTNATVALGLLVYMIVGASLCFLLIGYGHQVHKKQLDRNSMKASKMYQESREKSSKYSVKKQMEILAQKQGKTVKKSTATIQS